MQDPITILIIDDEPVSRHSIESLLLPEGYQFEFASDGVEGLWRAAKLQPDVILLDVMMPEMDGFETCQHLRADPRIAEVPIIMITALDDQASRLRGLEVGADDFISKPFNRSELRARLRTITRLNRYRLLQNERARFAWIAEQASDGYMILDDHGNMVYTNPRARFFLDIPEQSEELVLSFIDVVRTRYQLLPEDAWQAWPTTDPEAILYLVVPETSTAQAFWLRVQVLSSENYRSIGLLVHLRDVTEQIANQADMRRFHSVLDHKFRTPLSHIQMSMDLILRHAHKRQLPDFIDMARLAREGIERLKSEIDTVFRYTKAPLLAYPQERVSLEALKGLAEQISVDLDFAGLTVDLPDELQAAALTVSLPVIEMILWEILDNAWKFHPEHKPHVTLSFKPLPKHTVCIRVEDDGVHLSPHQLQWAWVPYIQGEKFFTGEAPGMGLGLPLVSTLIWNTGGRVKLLNRSDKPGVAVEIRLPLYRDS